MADTAPTDPTHPAAADPDDDLEALLRAANRGDRAAYARFLRAVAALLGDIIAAHGPDMPPAQHERILHEVLFALHDNRHTWCATAPFRAWFWALVDHRITASLRREGRAVALRPEDFSGVPHSVRDHAATAPQR